MNTEYFWNKIDTKHKTRFSNEYDLTLSAEIRHFGEISSAKFSDSHEVSYKII